MLLCEIGCVAVPRSPANRKAPRPRGKPLQKEKVMSAKEEKCDILFVTKELGRGEALGKLERISDALTNLLGISINVRLFWPPIPRELLKELATLKPKVLLADLMSGGTVLVNEAQNAYGELDAAKILCTSMPPFESLFGESVMITDDVFCRPEEFGFKHAFVWEPGKDLDDDQLVMLAKLVDEEGTLQRLAGGVRPALNHRLRDSLIVLALQAESHTEAKEHALNFLRDSGVNDAGVVDRLAKAVRWLNIVWTNYRERFEVIVFPRIWRHRSIPLHNAVCLGSADAVAEMLAEVDEPYAGGSSPGHSPLLYLAAADSPRFASEKKGIDAPEFRILRMLLESGLDPNTRWKGGKNTPAIAGAAKEGLMHSIEILLQYGADPCLTDDEGNTALHHAVVPTPPAASGSCNVVEALFRIGDAKFTMLRDARNKQGLTALGLAIREKNTKAERLLRAAGAVE